MITIDAIGSISTCHTYHMSSDKSHDNNLPCRFNINWSI